VVESSLLPGTKVRTYPQRKTCTIAVPRQPTGLAGIMLRVKEMRETPERLFGARFAELRHQNGWTQQQVTEAMVERGFSWSATTATKTEAGSRPIRVDEAVVLCELFDATFDDLVGGTKERRARFALARAAARVKAAQREVDRWTRELGQAEQQRASLAAKHSELSGFTSTVDELEEADDAEHSEAP